MIISCPSCETRFLLDDADIPAQGRKVRCIKCDHVWHQEEPGLSKDQAGPPPSLETPILPLASL